MVTKGKVVNADLNYIIENLSAELTIMSGSKLIITGGAGFLGYYLVKTIDYWNEHFPTKAIDLMVLDNFIRGKPAWLSQLYDSKNMRLQKHSVVKKLPKSLGDFDYIIHAASIASPTFYRLHPIETMDANVVGLRNLLDYSVALKQKNYLIKGFLFFSSSEIYGNPPPDKIPTKEDYWGNVSCTGPRACYDESKRYGETLCVNFANQHDLPIVSVRPFNNYGPGLAIDDKRVIPDFMSNVLSGKDIVMLSDGSPRRTFCYIADAVIGYYKALVLGKKGEAYNIGIQEPEVSILELAEKIVAIAKKQIDYPGKVVKHTSHDPAYLTDNPQRRCPDITKARTELDYHPQISLQTGLENSLAWYKGN